MNNNQHDRKLFEQALVDVSNQEKQQLNEIIGTALAVAAGIGSEFHRYGHILARLLPDGRLAIATHQLLEWTGGRGQDDRKVDRPPFDVDVLDHIEGHEILSQVRLLDLPQCLKYVLLCHV